MFRLLLCLYSPSLESIFNALTDSHNIPGISLQATSQTITNLLAVLMGGIAYSAHKRDLQSVVGTAKTIGINLSNCQIGQKRVAAVESTTEKEMQEAEHSEATEMKEKRYFTCRNCGQKFDREWNLKRHQLTHDEGVRYPCQMCESTFARMDNLEKHAREAHGAASSLDDEAPEPTHIQDNESVWRCSYCGKVLKSKKLLMRHENIHAGVKFTCSLCPWSTNRKDNLATHMKKKHGSIDMDTHLKDQPLTTGTAPSTPSLVDSNVSLELPALAATEQDYGCERDENEDENEEENEDN